MGLARQITDKSRMFHDYAQQLGTTHILLEFAKKMPSHQVALPSL
jgi:hypothetical protein